MEDRSVVANGSRNTKKRYVARLVAAFLPQLVT